ncbi:hypothetical protein PYW08_009468 [Mythimna loreyi]|uniref:Uncharacterized protein n=1 Tax=Mythimna loreyi TaxID=667449 RepID=A0ACC2Q615_9NEOP|nr:hypothetical protein PYW08_009468 [Mythimna loreyi]
MIRHLKKKYNMHEQGVWQSERRRTVRRHRVERCETCAQFLITVAQITTSFTISSFLTPSFNTFSFMDFPVDCDYFYLFVTQVAMVVLYVTASTRVFTVPTMTCYSTAASCDGEAALAERALSSASTSASFACLSFQRRQF